MVYICSTLSLGASVSICCKTKFVVDKLGNFFYPFAKTGFSTSSLCIYSPETRAKGLDQQLRQLC